MIKDTHRSLLIAKKMTSCQLEKKPYPFTSEANDNTTSNSQSINWNCMYYGPDAIVQGLVGSILTTIHRTFRCLGAGGKRTLKSWGIIIFSWKSNSRVKGTKNTNIFQFREMAENCHGLRNQIAINRNYHHVWQSV